MAGTLVERLRLLVDADTKGAVRGFDKVGKSANRNLGGAESSVARLGRTVTSNSALIAGGLAVAGAATVDLANSAGELRAATGAVEAVFDSSASSVRAFAEEAARLGLSQTRASQIASGLGGQLKSLGFSSQEAAGELEKLVERAADTATGISTTEDAIASFAALLRGEGDPIEKFGVSIKQADVNARVLALGLDTSTTAAKKQAETIARLDLLYEQTADRAGLYGSEANTLAREQQELSAEFENLKATIGEAVVPAVTSLIGVVTSLVEVVNGAVGPIVSFAEALKDIPGAKALGWGETLELLDEQEVMLERAGDAAAELGSAMSGAASGGAKSLGSAMRSLIGDIGGVSSSLVDLSDSIFDEFFSYRDALRGVDDASRGVAQAQRDYVSAQRDVISAAADVEDAQIAVARAQMMVFDSAEAARRGILDYANAQRGITDPVFAFIDALDRQQEMLNAVDPAGEKAFGSNLDDPLDLFRGSADLEQAAIGLVGAIQTGQTSIGEVIGKLQEGVAEGFIPEDFAKSIEKRIKAAVKEAEELEGSNVSLAASTEVAAAKEEFAADKADALREAHGQLADAQDRLREAQDKVAEAADDVTEAHEDSVRAAYDFDTALADLNRTIGENPALWDAARAQLNNWVARGLVAKETAELIRDALQEAADAANELADTDLTGNELVGRFIDLVESIGGSIFGGLQDASGIAAQTRADGTEFSLAEDFGLFGERDLIAEHGSTTTNNVTFNVEGPTDAEEINRIMAWTLAAGPR